MKRIEIKHLTKDYGDGRGIFDINFDIEQGEVFGFLGPNGAGKTTTIRQILGFITPEQGEVLIDGANVSEAYFMTNARIGYLPGEITFPDGMNGWEFIRWNAELRGLKDLRRAKMLLDTFELKNVDSPVKRMSKGMKQKIGLVCAMMHSPDILILDEPTSGLDPLMQETFIKVVQAEKRLGTTILMSSHMFPEIEKTCDRVAIIKNGKIIANIRLADIKKSSQKLYKVKFTTGNDAVRFSREDFDCAEINPEKTRVKVRLDDADINRFIQTLGKYKLKYFSEIKPSLEQYFMHYYEQDKKEERN